MKTSLLDLIAERIPIIFDGAIGTEIQKYRLTAEDYGGAYGCDEFLSVTRPDIVRSIHAAYLAAGAMVIETNTFQGSRFKLAGFGLEGQVFSINRAAAQCAVEAVARCTSDGPKFVCGTMGPTGFLHSQSASNKNTVSFDECAAAYEEQARALLEGGVDLLLLETMQDLLEVRAGIYGINNAFKATGGKVPVQVQVTMDATGRMLLGSDVAAFLGAVGNFDIDIMGLNCSVGPVQMEPVILDLITSSPFPVSMIPNAGMPENIQGTAVYTMSPDFFAHALVPMVVDHGVAVVGGCCGTSIGHIQKLVELLKGKKVAARSHRKRMLFLGTGISGIEVSGSEKPFIIGERLNAQGSKQTKEHLLAGNWDELYQIGLQQQEKGCGALDLAVAVSEMDAEKQLMVTLVRFLSERLEVPFCIDSTTYEVIAAALKNNPSGALINSINLEHDGAVARRICTLARDFACPLIGLPIDDAGMAKTVERKLSCADRLVDLVCRESGMPLHHLFFDPLVFTLATGDPESGHAVNLALEALSQVKKRYPEIRTVMGVSNVSYGLQPKARRVLNNLLLHHAAARGLDAAIFNPLHRDDVQAYETHIREAGEALLFNKNSHALADFIVLFEKPVAKEPKAPAERIVSPERQLRDNIMRRDKRGLAECIAILLKRHDPQTILDTVLLPAMAEVGDKMAKGEMILPFVLQAAEVMQQALKLLEPHFGHKGAGKKGTIVMATVFGDVHDIGKNLVATIVRSQGYEVIDLGKQVRCEEIVASVKKHSPDAVGLSALLVTTSRQMGICVSEFHGNGISIPVLIGGAAVNKAYAERIAHIDETTEYAGGVYYAKDAFEGLKILDSIRDRKKITQSSHPGKPANSTAVSGRLDVSPASPLEFGDTLIPPYYGTGDMLTWDHRSLLEKIDKDRLFKAQWRGGALEKGVFEKTKLTDFEPAFTLLRREIEEGNLIEPRGFYGYFPVITDDTTLVVLDPYDFKTELAHWAFPRLSRKKGRSFADYFRPEGDVLAIQAVTIGGKIGERCTEYFKEGQQSSLGFFLYELGNYLTEDCADRISAEIRAGLGIRRDIGRRFSFGYEGMPGLEVQKTIFEFMSIEDRIGIHLTEGFQMVPEHSTIGLFAYHPSAEY